jgi:branched-chain amino acid transport system substrate-binding protein
VPTRRPALAPLALAALLGGILAGACGGAVASAGAGGDTVYIALAASPAVANQAYRNGVRLAIEQLNAARPAGTRPFGLRLQPESLTSQVAVAAAFRDDPRVIGVVGHTGSGQTLEAAPVYADLDQGGRRALVAITPTATNPALTRASEWLFRVCPTDDDAARALARFAYDSLRARRAAVIYRNDLFGRGFLRAFALAFERYGGLVVERDPYLSGLTEFAAYAERIRRREAEVVVLAGANEDAEAVLSSLRAAGARAAVLGTDDLAALAGRGGAGSAARGVRFISFYLPGQGPGATARVFDSLYQARFGTLPDHRAALSYDAARLLGAAVIAVGPDRRRVREWLAGVGTVTPPFEGVAGPIRFNVLRNAMNKPVLLGEVGR